MNKWDSEKLHYACDKEDKMDMCLYVNWTKIKIEPSSSEESDEWMEHTFEIGEEESEALGEWKHKIAIRMNGKTVETLNLLITNPEEDEEDNED